MLPIASQKTFFAPKTSSLKTIFSNSLLFFWFFEFKISAKKTIANGIKIAKIPKVILLKSDGSRFRKIGSTNVTKFCKNRAPVINNC